MRPIRTPQADRDFVDGPGTDVYPLPCYEDLMGAMCSVWELSDDDREALLQGGYVELTIDSPEPPPVGLSIVGPYHEEAGKNMEWSSQLQTWVAPEVEDTVEL